MIQAYIFVRSNACDNHRFYYGEFSSVEEAEQKFAEDYPETKQQEGEYFWKYSLELSEE